MPRSIVLSPRETYSSSLHQLKIRNAKALLILLKETAELQSNLISQICELIAKDGKQPEGTNPQN